MTARGRPLPIDAGLVDRFLAAEREVAWEDGPGPAGARAPPGVRVRRAVYHDERARVERRTRGRATAVTVTAGPVGALLLVAECARRGLPAELASVPAGERAGFPDGGIEARWAPGTGAPRHALPLADVVGLARYALV